MPDSVPSSAENSLEDLNALLEPVGLDTFLSEYRHRKPLHISAAADRFQSLMSWEILNRLLNQTTIWSSQSLLMIMDGRKLDPPEYCKRLPNRDGGEVWRPDSQLVSQWLGRGATIVPNDIDQLTAEMSSLASEMERALEAKVQMNLYCSSQAHQGFGPHYDNHEVFALHIAGEKTWKLYEMSGMDHPINHPSFYRPDKWHAENCGDLTAEVTLKPGDLLYLPRGWYHEALATDGTVIHIAVGVTAPIGLDVMQLLTASAVTDPLFRTDLPLTSDKQGFAARMMELGKRLQSMSTDPRVLAALEEHCRTFGWPRGSVALPTDMNQKRWKVSAHGVSVTCISDQWVLEKGKTRVPIPAGWEDLCQWVVAQERFTEGEFKAAFPALADSSRMQFLQQMAGMKLINA